MFGQKTMKYKKGRKLLKELWFLEELTVWKKKETFYQKNSHKTLNFDITNEDDLTKKFVIPSPEHENRRPMSLSALMSRS